MQTRLLGSAADHELTTHELKTWATSMTDTRLTIRQMCDLFDVTPRTLRFYEAKELLFPERVGQTRFFTPKDRARMTLIQKGKRYGFSLEEIRQLLELYYVGDGQRLQIERTLSVANQRLDDMVSRRDDLNHAIAELESQIDEAKDFLTSLNTQKDAAE